MPVSLCERYLALQTACGQLRMALEQGATELKSQPHQLQQDFQALLAVATPAQQQSLQRFNSEIFKDLRLFNGDRSAWAIAKQVDTRAKRAERVRERCDRLVTYIERVQELLQEEADTR